MVKFKAYKINYNLVVSILILIIILIISIGIYKSAIAKTQEYIKVPIIMYHSILKSRSGKYIVHPSEFENDLKYIRDNGYITITMSDLINYVYNSIELPSKPIIITLDDGYYNNYEYVFPLLKKYNMKAVISIVGIYTDEYSKTDEANPNYSYLRWKDINKLINDGSIEFQNHTYNLHKNKNGRQGCEKKYGESLEQYDILLSKDIMKLQGEFSKNTGYIPNTFTYPFGAISDESFDIIKKLGFKASLSCTAGINYITKNPECLYKLKRNNRVGGISTQVFFKNIYTLF